MHDRVCAQTAEVEEIEKMLERVLAVPDGQRKTERTMTLKGYNVEIVDSKM